MDHFQRFALPEQVQEEYAEFATYYQNTWSLPLLQASTPLLLGSELVAAIPAASTSASYLLGLLPGGPYVQRLS